MKPSNYISPRVVPEWLRQDAPAHASQLGDRALACFWKTECLFRTIDTLVREHAEPNWDGYDAAALSPNAAEVAKRLITAMPAELPLPEACPEPDGGIGLDWMVAPDMICSVGCSPDGSCCFAALMGDASASGAFPFGASDAFPESLAKCIREVASHA